MVNPLKAPAIGVELLSGNGAIPCFFLPIVALDIDPNLARWIVALITSKITPAKILGNKLFPLSN
jgi:hypothetical protein